MADFIPFKAQTRMSGVDIDGRQIRKGAHRRHRQQYRRCHLPPSVEEAVDADLPLGRNRPGGRRKLTRRSA